MHDFFSRHFSIQDQQEKLIKAIADKPGVILNCTAPVTLTHIPASPNTILEALRKYGLIEIELSNNAKFTLRNNGICSIRLGMGSVVSLGLSMGFAAAYGYYQYQAITSSQGVSDNADVALANTSPESWWTLAGASVPIKNLYEYFVTSSYSQELDLLKAIDEIVKMYQEYNRLHELPIEVLQVAENYIDKDDAKTNYNILGRAQTDAKIEIVSKAHTRELDSANQKIDRLEGELNAANTSLNYMEQKMRDMESHALTSSEVLEVKDKLEFFRQNQQFIDVNPNTQETTRLLDGHNNGAPPMLTQQQMHAQANQNQATNSANTVVLGEGSQRKSKPGCTIC